MEQFRAKGKIRKNEIRRYEIVEADGFRYELRSGDGVEIKIGNEWIKTSIEHSDRYGGYYAVACPRMDLTGVEARVR